MATMILICSTCRASVFMTRLTGYPMMAPMTIHMMKSTMKPAGEGDVSRGLRARKGIIEENLVPSGKRTALSVLPEDRGGNTPGMHGKRNAIYQVPGNHSCQGTQAAGHQRQDAAAHDMEHGEVELRRT